MDNKNRLPGVEEYIPEAIKTIKAEFINWEAGISRTYSGYIASFGASMIQSGLIPTLAFFSSQSSKDDQASPDRTKIVKLIWKLLKTKMEIEIRKISLLEYVLSLDNLAEREQIEEQIKRIAIALKLALRTFKLTGGGIDEV